jgi:hypothetical protein
MAQTHRGDRGGGDHRDRALVPGSSGKSLPIDVAVGVAPKASSKCLIFLAVAVVAVKICRGVCVDDTVVVEGS